MGLRYFCRGDGAKKAPMTAIMVIINSIKLAGIGCASNITIISPRHETKVQRHMQNNAIRSEILSISLSCSGM